jgi:hypothetical protein
MFAGTSTPSVLHYSTFFGGSTGSPMASEPGNRARCIDIIRSGSRAGMPVFCGATTMTDFAAITTPSVLFPNWFLPGGGTDNRTGFIAVHDAN